MRISRKKLNIELYKKLYLIRKAEERIQGEYSKDEMKTPMHMSMGGEAISAGVCHALGASGQAFSSYRSHGVYLAKTMETDKFFAELYGKKTGVAKGKAGSMHLSAPEKGYLGASAVVGTPIPLAVGAAFANVRRNNKNGVGVFCGEGAVDEGVFWESINMAALWKLPVLFVCEDNGLAIHTPPRMRHGYDSIAEVISKFKVNVLSSDSTDAEEIHKVAMRGINLIYTNKRPCFLHLKYYRYLEHVGINPDFSTGYRSEKEFKKWKERDPVLAGRQKLLKLGVAEKNISALENKINAGIERSMAGARKAPFSSEKELFKDIFYEKS